MIRPVTLGSFLRLEIRKSPNLAQYLRPTARNRKKGEEGKINIKYPVLKQNKKKLQL